MDEKDKNILRRLGASRNAPVKSFLDPKGPRVSVEEYNRREATKFDKGKPSMDLLPPKALKGIAEVFGYGAKKYEDFNYKQGKGLLWSRVYAACLRHLNDWNDGEDLDPESGKPHLYHAGCCVMMLIDLVDSSIGTDGRFKGPNDK